MITCSSTGCAAAPPTGGRTTRYRFVRAAYRTAFVSLSRDNTPNDNSIVANADVIEDALPKIAARFGVEQVFVVAHSKGGLDVQEVIARERVSSLVRAVFTISSPNTGTEIADWAFGPGELRKSWARDAGRRRPAHSGRGDVPRARRSHPEPAADSLLHDVGHDVIGGTRC